MPDDLPFDPEEIARLHGEKPPANVRPLTMEERRAFKEWATTRVQDRGIERTLPVFQSLDTETDLFVLADALWSLSDTVRAFFAMTTTPDPKQQLLLWDEFVFMHLIIDKLEALILGMEIEPAKEKEQERRSRRRAVQEP